MPSLSFREGDAKADDITALICNYSDLPAVVRIGHKEASQCALCGKLSGVKENLLALCGYGCRDDCGIYRGESGKTKVGEAVSQKLCGGERANVAKGICAV